jgi:hypothetical protein
MKINNFTMQQQEKSFEEYLGYEEWLRDNLKAPSEDELNHMEQSIKRSSTLNKHIINNLHYQPRQGA